MKLQFVKCEGQSVCGPDLTMKMTARQTKDLLIVLHRTHVADEQYDDYLKHSGVHEVMGDDGLYGGNDIPRQIPARFIAETNYTEGWASTPLTGDYWEDFEAAQEDGNIHTDYPSMIANSRSLFGSRRAEGATNIRLDRPQLELAVLADQLMRECSQPVTRFDKVDQDRQRAAIADAQAMFAHDRDAALDRIAAPLFQGTTEQKRQQLKRMLDGPKPGTVLCRHCYQPIDAADPYLMQDQEDDRAMQQWTDATATRLPRHASTRSASARYSAHFDCHNLRL